MPRPSTDHDLDLEQLIGLSQALSPTAKRMILAPE
jgi:hypothetical protein